MNSEYWLSLTIYWLFVWERLICGSYYQKPAHRLVLQKAVELQGKIVECPKVLGDIRGGISHIYPMLYRFGIIEVSEKIAAKMQLIRPNPKKQ